MEKKKDRIGATCFEFFLFSDNFSKEKAGELFFNGSKNDKYSLLSHVIK